MIGDMTALLTETPSLLLNTGYYITSLLMFYNSPLTSNLIRTVLFDSYETVASFPCAVVQHNGNLIKTLFIWHSFDCLWLEVALWQFNKPLDIACKDLVLAFSQHNKTKQCYDLIRSPDNMIKTLLFEIYTIIVEVKRGIAHHSI